MLSVQSVLLIEASCEPSQCNNCLRLPLWFCEKLSFALAAPWRRAPRQFAKVMIQLAAL
jgi:hypothetical protein